MIARTTVTLGTLMLALLPSFGQEKRPVVDSLLHEAYTLLPVDRAASLPIFERAATEDSACVIAFRQLGSLYSSLGRPADAITAYRHSLVLVPSDTVRLEVAYLLSSLERHEEAARLFADLAGADNSWIRTQAAPAALISTELACARRKPWWGQIQAYPYYDSRFETLVAAVSVTAGRLLDSAGTVSLFGTALATWDTRSTGGVFPVLYADHVVLVGAGIRFQPLPGFSVDVLGGLSYDLIPRPGLARFRGDTRAVASYGHGLYPGLDYDESPRWNVRPLADFYLSAGWYSRFENVIGLVQGRAGADLISYRSASASAYLRANAGWDTRGDFYNRVLEVGPGLRLVPHRSWGLSLAFEALRGFYWSSSAADSPYGPAYTSFRFFLLVDRSLCL